MRQEEREKKNEEDEKKSDAMRSANPKMDTMPVTSASRSRSSCGVQREVLVAVLPAPSGEELPDGLRSFDASNRGESAAIDGR